MSSLGFYSTENSSNTPLNLGEAFLGSYVSTLNFSEIDITVKMDTQQYLLLVEFSIDGNESADPDKIITILGTLTPPVFVNLHKVQPFLKFVRIRLTNTFSSTTYTSINTILKSTVTYEDVEDGPISNVNIVSPLVGGAVAVNVQNFPSIANPLPIKLDAIDSSLVNATNNNGLKVSVENATLDVDITSSITLPVADAVLDNCVSSNKVNVNISSTTGILPVADAVLDDCVADNLVNVLDSSTYKPVNNGVVSEYVFIPTAVNNAPSVYADGTKGTDTSTGWSYQNTGAPNKINWYLYTPTFQVPITDLTSVNATNTFWTKIENTGVELPFMILYTRPTYPANKNAGGAGGSSWYQSKWFFQAQVAGTAGEKLLYVGKDPVDLYPSIPHIKLVKLAVETLGTLQPDELILTASLQTSGNIASPAGNFNFIMNAYGVRVEEVKTSVKSTLDGQLMVTDTILDNCVSSNKLSVADSVLDACVSSNKVNVNLSSNSAGTLAVTEATLDACISANKVNVRTVQNVSQVGVKGNIQIANFTPLASTNHFNCAGYGDVWITYQDTSPLNTGDMIIFASVNDTIPDNEVSLGKLIPVVNANASNRYGSVQINLRAFNQVWIFNNSTTDTNTNSIISIFSY